MLKVKNKKVVGEIAGITYRANRKRNLLTIFAIFLTTFLLAFFLSVGTSYWNTVSERQIRMEGMDYDIELSEPREDQVEAIRSMEQVRYAGVAVKCALLEQYQDRMLDKVRLYWLDKTCWEKQTVPALESLEGSYPEKKDEILLGKNTLNAMGIQNPKAGMRLPLTYYTLEAGTEEELLEKEFTLSGWYTDYSGTMRGYVSRAFLEESGVKQTDFTQGTLKITLKNPLYTEKDIRKLQEAIAMDRNQYIGADLDSISAFLITAAGLCALLLMVFASGYLFIYNTMYISISKDIRYYGQLKTIGMTSAQLKGIVYRQAVRNALAGIPLGLLAAAAVSGVVIPQLLHLAAPAFSIDEIAPANVLAFVLGGGFAFLTNLFSCRKPAGIAGDCSPMEAVRYTARTGRKRSRRREGGGICSMAVQNMFRDTKQAVIIFSSFIIAILVFMVVNMIVRENDARRILDEVYPYDVQFKNETTLDDRIQLITEDKIDRIRAIEGVKSVSRVTSEEVIVPYQEDVYGDYFKALYQTRYSPGNYEEDMELYRRDPGSGYFAPRFISIDENEFERLNRSLGNALDREDFEQGKIAVVIKYFTEGDHGMTGKTVRFYFPDEAGRGTEHTIRIAAVGDGNANPAFFAGGIVPNLIVSEAYAKKLRGELFTELIHVDYETAYARETEQKVQAVFEEEKEISHESKLERYTEMKNTEIQVKVLGSSIGCIIAVLAVLNYLNTIAASVQNRSRELAALESIGMTTGQIRAMLRAEGIGYAVISILLSSAIGFPASYFVFSATAPYRISFSVPWMSNFVLFGTVLFLCMAAPVLIYRRTQNASIIERLRNSEE